MNKKVISVAELFLTAFIWGIAFVAQSVGMDYIGPFTFNCIRFLIGGIVLIPVILVFGRDRKEERTQEETKMYRKNTILGGIVCGFFLWSASTFQQFGIVNTSVGKAGFITALYIVLVPILGIFLHKKVTPLMWLSVIIAVIGFYMLCISGHVTINKGDLYVLVCAVLFSFHILVIDHFSPGGNGIAISCIQFFVSGIISAVFMALFESPQITQILAAYVPLLYAGVMSCGVAYTLQILGQKHTEPTVACLIMSLESVFSALAGWVILHEKLSAKELIGCALVFLAVILAQLPQKEKQ